MKQRLADSVKMEELREALVPLNLNLYLSGSPLFVSKKKWLRVALNLYGIWLLVAPVYDIIVLMPMRDPAESSILVLLTIRVWETAYNGCASSTILIIWVSRHQLLEILGRVSCFLEPNNGRFLFRMSLVLIFHSTLYIVLFRGYFFYIIVNRVIEEMWNLKVYELFYIMVNILLVLHYWENIVLSLFTVTLTAVHLAEGNALERLQESLEKKVDYAEWVAMENMKYKTLISLQLHFY